MAAHNKPLRWQNSDEAQAHLSTTRFHMQVAAPSSHRSRRLCVLPYQSLARSSCGEITGSEQSVRQSARLAHHMREKHPLSHAQGKYCHCSSPSGWYRMNSAKIFSLQRGTDHSTRKRTCKSIHADAGLVYMQLTAFKEM